MTAGLTSLLRRHAFALATALALVLGAALCVAYGSAVRSQADRLLLVRTLREAANGLESVRAEETFPRFAERAQDFENSAELYLLSDAARRFPSATRAIAGALDEVRSAHEAWAQAAETDTAASRPVEADSRLQSAEADLVEAKRLAEPSAP